jgi:hypothetical protein
MSKKYETREVDGVFWVNKIKGNVQVGGPFKTHEEAEEYANGLELRKRSRAKTL